VGRSSKELSRDSSLARERALFEFAVRHGRIIVRPVGTLPTGTLTRGTVVDAEGVRLGRAVVSRRGIDIVGDDGNVIAALDLFGRIGAECVLEHPVHARRWSEVLRELESEPGSAAEAGPAVPGIAAPTAKPVVGLPRVEPNRSVKGDETAYQAVDEHELVAARGVSRIPRAAAVTAVIALLLLVRSVLSTSASDDAPDDRPGNNSIESTAALDSLAPEPAPTPVTIRTTDDKPTDKPTSSGNAEQAASLDSSPAALAERCAGGAQDDCVRLATLVDPTVCRVVGTAGNTRTPWLNLRSGPSFQTRELARLADGTEVAILTPGKPLTEVVVVTGNAAGKRGWASVGFLRCGAAAVASSAGAPAPAEETPMPASPIAAENRTLAMANDNGSLHSAGTADEPAPLDRAGARKPVEVRLQQMARCFSEESSGSVSTPPQAFIIVVLPPSGPGSVSLDNPDLRGTAVEACVRRVLGADAWGLGPRSRTRLTIPVRYRRASGDLTINDRQIIIELI
jgi:hypothetical protein